MTTLEKMLELSGQMVSVSAQRKEEQKFRAQSMAARNTNANIAAAWTIQQFRSRRLHKPAGNGDHRFHGP